MSHPHVPKAKGKGPLPIAAADLLLKREETYSESWQRENSRETKETASRLPQRTRGTSPPRATAILRISQCKKESRKLRGLLHLHAFGYQFGCLSLVTVFSTDTGMLRVLLTGTPHLLAHRKVYSICPNGQHLILGNGDLCQRTKRTIRVANFANGPPKRRNSRNLLSR